MKPILSLKNITKSYPGVIALHDVSMTVASGEVHALLGENGAGKSTLIKVISGAVTPDCGTITIDGTDYSALTPHTSREEGIEVIYQEFNLVETLSAAENISLGIRHGKFVDFKAMERVAREIFRDFSVDIDPSALVRDLPTSHQQIVEIAKAVSRNARLLIMDEPTAPLTVSEVDTLFRIIRDARKRGVTIIYISHRIDEIFAIADRVTVLRDGRYISTLPTVETDRKHLVSLMVGRELTESYPPRRDHASRVVLELRNVTGNGVRDVTFSLHQGEVLGLGGLVGAGRTELAKVLYGAAPLESGEIVVEGSSSPITAPHDAISRGIGLIPENRKEEGCFIDQTVRWNISIMAIRQLARRGIVDRKAEDNRAMEYHDLLQIKTPSLSQKVLHLSGGNQQKVVIGKVLASNSRILIFDEPTRGIDVGARQEIYRLMASLAEEGCSIIMITSDMEELLGMSDRIVVLHEGRVNGILERGEFSQERVLELASGMTQQEEAV